jgi:hypothetical protein
MQPRSRWWWHCSQDPNSRAAVIDRYLQPGTVAAPVPHRHLKRSLISEQQSIRFVWYVGIAFAGLGWVSVWLEKEVTLRSRLNSKFGLEEKKNKEDGEANTNNEPGRRLIPGSISRRILI